MPSRVRASSAISSSVAGTGTRMVGSRVSSMRRAVAVSAVIGAIARRASHSPAPSASAVPPRTPSARKIRTRATVRSMSETGRAYWTVSGMEKRVLRPDGVRISICRSRVSTRKSPIWVLRPGRRPKFGAPRVCSRICPLGSRTRMAALLAPP